MSEQISTLPYRVVDRTHQGWFRGLSYGTDTSRYTADYGFRRGLDDLTYQQLDEDRGPLRPVEPVTSQDEQRLQAAFDLAGRQAIITLAAAIEQVHYEYRREFGGRGRLNHPDSYNGAMRALRAGREGSWESELLNKVVWAGNRVNLVGEREANTASVDQRRELGPSKRVHTEVRGKLVSILRGWTSNPAHYTEVAENLATEVSRYADERYGEDGWSRIADQWLQPETPIIAADFNALYSLLYSRSAHFDPDVLG